MEIVKLTICFYQYPACLDDFNIWESKMFEHIRFKMLGENYSRIYLIKKANYRRYELLYAMSLLVSLI